MASETLPEASESPGREALAELDQVLASKPHAEGHTFSAATHHLCLLRDRMAREQRERGADADSRRRLEHVNAVISIVLAGHFPLGGVPWPELQKARGWLAALVAEDDARPPRHVP